jgi:phosphatidylserine decarboxylase
MTAATFAAAQLLRVLPRSRITRAVGRLVDLRLHPKISSAIVNVYSKIYQVALEDAVMPDGAFESFDEFFTRRLREGLRPLHPDESVVVSPADGRIEDIGPITAGGRLVIKGSEYGVADLVGDPADVARYAGGQFVVVYLSPRDYHRVHAPIGGEIPVIRSMPGDYYPVNSIGVRHVPSLFSRNRRVAIVIDTKTHGRVTVVMVSAMVVGRISVSGIDARDVPIGTHRMDPPRPVARGEEIGIFRLGSTAVVFVEKGASPQWTRNPGPILFGEPLTAIGDRKP